MHKKLSQNITYWLGVVAIGLVVGVSLQFVRAWTEPSVAPPGGNVGAPINTGGITQTRSGQLTVNNNLIANDLGSTTLSVTSNANLATVGGNVGIGTASPGTNKLQVNGKIQAIGGDICTDQGGGKCLSAAGGGITNCRVCLRICTDSTGNNCGQSCTSLVGAGQSSWSGPAANPTGDVDAGRIYIECN